MARTRVLLAAIACLTLETVMGVTWIKGGGGLSCDSVCASRSGCAEDVWPTAEEEFHKAAADAGFDCVGTQEGGAKYDPSTDGRYCGWSGPDGESGDGGDSDGPRCAATGDSSTYRFCPCNSDREL
mmetsp:Transcript_4544/g.11685  ORF Transcript_4544/g.11685 Transcript_4544/m.11685 type:complete len:126 (-) Transcript_4544:61-438(-)|eukprot:CAMPEP_0195064106 /NCGR_PEP_ID=MMETSP0448-20130528/10302_1 /TAXON_ID=66468 /ORGANISM="Heterocapsa triquestra, Strain CCMP 448" /LENGTH=125 /DNA_ID=CAMNT_0040095101 /DNA_START=54 /DNA_END=431 /DNA_ORIENTATION=-